MTETRAGRLERLSYGRRTIMGAIAAGVGLGAIGGVTAQEDDDDDDDAPGDDQDDDDEEDDDAMDDQNDGEDLLAALAGSNHGVFTEAHGAAHFSHADGELHFHLLLEDIECVTQAHIHEGNCCESGPVVAPLVQYTADPAGQSEGAQEEIQHAETDDPIVESGVVGGTDDPGEDGDDGGDDEDDDSGEGGDGEQGGDDGPGGDLVQQIVENPSDYYVNVHTTKNPDGEIRGQIRGLDDGTPGDEPGTGPDDPGEGPDEPGEGPDDPGGNETGGDDGMGDETGSDDGMGNETDGDDGIGNETGGDDGTGNETDDDAP